MTKKDFIVIADMIGTLQCNNQIDAYDWRTRDIVDRCLRETNPNYKSATFWERVEKIYEG